VSGANGPERPPERGTPSVWDGLDGPAAPPRRNGELAFDEPWQARAFGVAQAVVEARFGGDREPFRQRLIAAIAAEPDRPYWESWAAALEDLVVAAGLVGSGDVDARILTLSSSQLA
jgi:hypothetical protein